jgi:phage-related protein
MQCYRTFVQKKRDVSVIFLGTRILKSINSAKISLVRAQKALRQVSAHLREGLIQTLTVNPADVATINHSAEGCT